jgi:hypothetical protein
MSIAHNSSDKVRLYVFLLQHTKNVQQWYCSLAIYVTLQTPNPTFVQLLAVRWDRVPLANQYNGSALYKHSDATRTMTKVFRICILSLISCIFLYVFSIERVMAIGTFMGFSSIVADITNSKKRTDSRQQVLRQRITVVCRLLVAIMTRELYFKAY